MKKLFILLTLILISVSSANAHGGCDMYPNGGTCYIDSTHAYDYGFDNEAIDKGLRELTTGIYCGTDYKLKDGYVVSTSDTCLNRNASRCYHNNIHFTISPGSGGGGGGSVEIDYEALSKSIADALKSALGAEGLTSAQLQDALKNALQAALGGTTVNTKVNWSEMASYLESALEAAFRDQTVNVNWAGMSQVVKNALLDIISSSTFKIDWDDFEKLFKDMLSNGLDVNIDWNAMSTVLRKIITDLLQNGEGIKIKGLQQDIYNALMDALQNGKLQIDWAQLREALPELFGEDGINVDWSDMPMYDFAEPTINVTRDTKAYNEPRSAEQGVRLTVTATDSKYCAKGPHYATEEGPISIIVDGKQYTNPVTTGPSAGVYTITDAEAPELWVKENRVVNIIAIDGNGNSRQYDVSVTNIDTGEPVIKSLTPSTTAWTRGAVTVTVDASDDKGLNSDGAYRWFFQSTTAQSEMVNPQPMKPSDAETDWTTENSHDFTESGNVWVEVRDTVGNTTTSPAYFIRNIDTTAPSVGDIMFTPGEAVKVSTASGVTVTIDVVNEGDPLTGEASPLAPLMVQWDENEPWRESNSIVVHENKILNVRVRDSVGNVSEIAKQVVVNQIADSNPVVSGMSTEAKGSVGPGVDVNNPGGWVGPPLELSIEATMGAGETAAPLHNRPFSWDGGHTWLLPNDTTVDGSGQITRARSTITVTENGQYTVSVRDTVGNITEQNIIISNIDNYAPTVNITTFKQPPANWPEGQDYTADDFVWWLEIDATDIGSGIDRANLHFAGPTADATPGAAESTLPFRMELQEPGIYGVTVWDKAGNSTYAEKTITYESMGEAGGAGAGTYVDIKNPNNGTGEAAFPGASISDLVYSGNYNGEGATKGKVYNLKTGESKAYTSLSFAGIEIHFNVTASASHWLTGYATFGSNNYPVYIAGSTDGGPVRGQGTGTLLNCVVKIPVAALNQDVKQGRVVIVMREWQNDPGSNIDPTTSSVKLLKEGSATLYTNVQYSPPKITYQYNRSTGKLNVVASSAVSGIAPGYPTVNGAVFTEPVPVNTEVSSTIELVAMDNNGLETKLSLNSQNLPVNGEGGGTMGSQVVSGGANSYYMSGRSAEMYIIGGTKKNTDNVPSSSVMGSITGMPTAPASE